MKRSLKILICILCVLSLCVALTGCNAISSLMDKLKGGKTIEETKEGVTVLATPTLSCSGSVISWDPVTGAYRYCVKFTNTYTGDSDVIYVMSPSVDVDALSIAAGEYVFVVRAESNSSRYETGAFTPDENGVRVTVNATVSLDDVEIEVYRVAADKVLCVWPILEGAASYRVRIGSVAVDSTANFALVDADSSADVSVEFSVTGRPGYSGYSGQTKTVSQAADDMHVVPQDAFDLIYGAYEVDGFDGATDIRWDGASLNLTVDGHLTLSADYMNGQSMGYHYLQAKVGGEERHQLVLVSDSRPLQFVNNAGVVIDSMLYVLSQEGMTVYIRDYANVVGNIYLDETPLTEVDYTYANGILNVVYAFMNTFDEGLYTLTVQYFTQSGAAQSAQLAVQVSEPEVMRYDAATEQPLQINGIPSGTTAVVGGGITTADYTLTSGSVTFKSAYLTGMPAGVYDYWLASSTGGTYIALNIYNSTAAPRDVVLSYDEDATVAYGKFQCDCGKSAHSYSLDGGAYRLAGSNCVSLGAIARNVQHSFAVRCDTNLTTTTHTIRPTAAAVDYLNRRYSFEGRSYDHYISSVDEFCEALRYLAYGGNADYGNGNGVGSITVYIGNDVMSRSGSANDALSALLSTAHDRYTAPYSSSISVATIEGFDADQRTGPMTITLTFTAQVGKSYHSGMEPKTYSDQRTLLTDNPTPRTAYIEGLSVTQPVGNVQELADLPLGVRPVFDRNDVPASIASNVYEAALDVCHKYVNDSMTDVQKVQAMFDYLSKFVTYDYYSLVWYEINYYRSYLEQDVYNQWLYASDNYAKSCSDAERDAIKACHSYLDATKLVSAKATSLGTQFWTTWQSNFASYEEQALPQLRNYAIQQVNSRGYASTSLGTEVNGTFDNNDTYYDVSYVLQFHVDNSPAFDAFGALVHNTAVCDGISDALRILCLVEGINCVKVSGQGINSSGDGEAHAWNKVCLGGVWYCVDATWSGNDTTSHRYFMMPDSVFYADHKEQIDEVNAVAELALATGYNYYRNTEVAGHSLYVETAPEFRTALKAMYQAGERTIELYVAKSAYATETAFKAALHEVALELLAGSYSVGYNDGYVVIDF